MFEEVSAQNEQLGSPPEPLRFVNLDRSNLGRDASTKKIVRSHVMQRYRRGKALKMPTQGLLSSPPVWRERRPAQSPAEMLAELLGRLQNSGYACSCPRPGSPQRRHSAVKVTPVKEASSLGKGKPAPLFTDCQECGGCIQDSFPANSNLAPTSMLGAGKKDPFHTLPLSDQNQSFYLLDHYSHVVLGLSLPMNDHQVKWFKRALADEGLLHSLLLYAAKHNEILTGSSREVEIYCHRGEVMRIVTERIGSGPRKLIDTTIDAVACLVLFEEMFGCHDFAKAHRSGLEQLVTIRGGLDSLGTGSPLYKLVIWAGTKHSVDPIWEMAGYRELSTPHNQRQYSAPLLLSAYISSPSVPFDQLHPTQIELFCRLRNSTMLMSSLDSRTRTPNSTLSSSSITNISVAANLEFNEQYVLKARVCEELSAQRRLAESERRVAWLIATVLYASTILSYEFKSRNGQEQRRVVEQLVGSLRTALAMEMAWPDLRVSVESCSVEQDMNAASVLLWILFIGGVSANSFSLEEQSRWFGSAMKKLCAALGLGEWVDIRKWIKDLPLPNGEEVAGGKWWGWWVKSVEEFEE